MSTVRLRGNETLKDTDKVVALIDDYYRTPMGDVVFLHAGEEAPKSLRDGLLKVKFYSFGIIRAETPKEAPKQPLKEEVKKHEDGSKSKPKRV